MILSPADAALFHQAMAALMTWVNDQRNIVPHFTIPTPQSRIPTADALAIRNVMWNEAELIHQFLAVGAADLTAAQRDLVASWTQRIDDNFIVIKHLQKQSIFIGKHVYGVLGIFSPLSELVGNVPAIVRAVLLPFRNVIITDGLITKPGVDITIGPSIKRDLQKQYLAAQQSQRIITKFNLAVCPTPAPTQPEPPSQTAMFLPEEDCRAPFAGGWRIIETQAWSRDMLDLNQQATLTFDDQRGGSLQMIAIHASLDCVYSSSRELPRVDFSFEGHDDQRPMSGRATATIDAHGLMRGQLYIHRGDRSEFVAQRTR
jgi:hypothetical protein